MHPAAGPAAPVSAPPAAVASALPAAADPVAAARSSEETAVVGPFDLIGTEALPSATAVQACGLLDDPGCEACQ